MDPDLALLERWRAGDKDAGEQLFKRHFASIYRLFRHKAGAEADELVQRTFLACVASREQFRGQSSFRTYLFTVARHELFAHLRRRSRDERLDFEVSSIADLKPSPSTGLRKAEQIEQLRAALEQLPLEQQLLLELHYWHELDAAALGDVLGATPAAVRVRLVRARRALRAQLARPELAPAGSGARDRLVAALAELEAGDRHVLDDDA